MGQLYHENGLHQLRDRRRRAEEEFTLLASLPAPLVSGHLARQRVEAATRIQASLTDLYRVRRQIGKELMTTLRKI
ncbi:unnamed protein product [Protopolystoma xenopodis]|uniref:Uncharacterized protein n=1 Tax=Protopolystoma xenopodis TaxID=117903 RepID=A0A3S5B895_9PLAT|nr:unnamed protein product [Protopolystoma xenopodis]